MYNFLDCKNETQKLIISILDIVSNHGNYMMWSDAAQQVHTTGSRIHADLEVLLAEFKYRQENGLDMPRHLLVVEDSAKEQKSKIRQMFFAMLVKMDILESVQLLYLLVGHTHWKVDQIFSVLAREVKNMDAGLLTFDDLKKLMNKVYTQWLDDRKNYVHEVRRIPNLNDYFERVCISFLEFFSSCCCNRFRIILKFHYLPKSLIFIDLKSLKRMDWW